MQHAIANIKSSPFYFFVTLGRYLVTKETRMFGTRAVQELEKAGLGVLFKSHLVTENYVEMGSDVIETKAPTLKCVSQHLILSMAA